MMDIIRMINRTKTRSTFAITALDLITDKALEGNWTIFTDPKTRLKIRDKLSDVEVIGYTATPSYEVLTAILHYRRPYILLSYLMRYIKNKPLSEILFIRLNLTLIKTVDHDTIT